MTDVAKLLRRADWARDPELWAGRVEGRDLGTGVTVLFFSDDGPGKGPPLHVHPYDEVFIVRQGRARFTVGDETLIAGPGDIVLCPANVPHRFVTLDDGPYESTDIHLSDRWIQTDLE